MAKLTTLPAAAILAFCATASGAVISGDKSGSWHNAVGRLEAFTSEGSVNCTGTLASVSRPGYDNGELLGGSERVDDYAPDYSEDFTCYDGCEWGLVLLEDRIGYQIGWLNVKAIEESQLNKPEFGVAGYALGSGQATIEEDITVSAATSCEKGTILTMDAKGASTNEGQPVLRIDDDKASIYGVVGITGTSGAGGLFLQSEVSRLLKQWS